MKNPGDKPFIVINLLRILKKLLKISERYKEFEVDLMVSASQLIHP